MEKLFQGVARFRKEGFEEHRELFESLGRGQQPHTLLVGCVDSRVMPGLITNASPGEVFTVRNVANMVPAYSQAEDHSSTASAIEYAVEVLGVENIVVCGHSNCGGCAAMHKTKEELSALPLVSRWLEVSSDVPDMVRKELADGCTEDIERLTEQTNIVVQMRNLLSYPYIRERYEAGKISIFGWHYIIETGEVFNYNRDTEAFELVE